MEREARPIWETALFEGVSMMAQAYLQFASRRSEEEKAMMKRDVAFAFRRLKNYMKKMDSEKADDIPF